MTLAASTLIIGGARSGKSAYAERLIEANATAGLYLATAEAWDDEMKDRIDQHRARRGDFWSTVEEPLDLAAALAAEARPERPILVDCLTLWLSNLVGAERNANLEIGKLCAAIEQLTGPVVLVSNELGMSVVSESALTRRFVDLHGQLNQAVAATAKRALFITAGLPLVLKEETS